MPKHQFVPNNFEIPALLETDRFRLRMLSVNDVEKDYEAVIESRELLQTMFKGTWPRVGFTLEENLDDLERHQQEFLDRKAYTYTVVSLDETKVLGCIYINPPQKYSHIPEFVEYWKRTGSDAIVYMWVRQTEYDKGLDEVLFNTVKDWINKDWPFRKVNYPGRE
ncbi:MAG: GNAT family N-acetyltransferase [Promethearchaeota archaeon]|jgi:RimJ/RimL family protein N-acetyltransferase